MREAVRAEGADSGSPSTATQIASSWPTTPGALLDGDDVLFLWTLEMEREGRRTGGGRRDGHDELGPREGAERPWCSPSSAPRSETGTSSRRWRGPARCSAASPRVTWIRADLTTTGDGTLTGLHLAAFLAASGRKLSAQPRFVRTPQVLKNVRVKERIPFDEIPGFADARREAEARMSGSGRILLRYSGTEALARVMVEGADAALVESVAADLASHIGARLGA